MPGFCATGAIYTAWGSAPGRQSRKVKRLKARPILIGRAFSPQYFLTEFSWGAAPGWYRARRWRFRFQLSWGAAPGWYGAPRRRFRAACTAPFEMPGFCATGAIYTSLGQRPRSLVKKSQRAFSSTAATGWCGSKRFVRAHLSIRCWLNRQVCRRSQSVPSPHRFCCQPPPDTFSYQSDWVMCVLPPTCRR